MANQAFFWLAGSAIVFVACLVWRILIPSRYEPPVELFKALPEVERETFLKEYGAYLKQTSRRAQGSRLLEVIMALALAAFLAFLPATTRHVHRQVAEVFTNPVLALDLFPKETLERVRNGATVAGSTAQDDAGSESLLNVFDTFLFPQLDKAAKSNLRIHYRLNDIDGQRIHVKETHDWDYSIPSQREFQFTKHVTIAQPLQGMPKNTVEISVNGERVNLIASGTDTTESDGEQFIQKHFRGSVRAKDRDKVQAIITGEITYQEPLGWHSIDGPAQGLQVTLAYPEEFRPDEVPDLYLFGYPDDGRLRRPSRISPSKTPSTDGLFEWKFSGWLLEGQGFVIQWRKHLNDNQGGEK